MKSEHPSNHAAGHTQVDRERWRRAVSKRPLRRDRRQRCPAQVWRNSCRAGRLRCSLTTTRNPLVRSAPTRIIAGWRSNHLAALHEFKKSRKMPAVHLDFASARPRFRQIWRNYGRPSRLRSTPSFLMRPRRVLGLSFKIAAAPLGPSMRQLVCLRTSRMRSFSV
jgi:hypothetical protein